MKADSPGSLWPLAPLITSLPLCPRGFHIWPPGELASSFCQVASFPHTLPEPSKSQDRAGLNVKSGNSEKSDLSSATERERSTQWDPSRLWADVVRTAGKGAEQAGSVGKGFKLQNLVGMGIQLCFCLAAVEAS